MGSDPLEPDRVWPHIDPVAARGWPPYQGATRRSRGTRGPTRGMSKGRPPYRKEVGGAPNTRLNAKRNEMSELNPQAAEISDIGLFVFTRSRFASSRRAAR